MAATIKAVVEAEIPVMAHIGLTPQSIRRLGAYKVQRAEEVLLADALAVAEAGAFAMVVECVPAELAAKITRESPIPTIGIGAGPGCDGQVLVLHDMLGLLEGFRPKFAATVRRDWPVGQEGRRELRPGRQGRPLSGRGRELSLNGGLMLLLGSEA